MTHELHPDPSAPARVDTTEMEWQTSPAAGVARKRLELRGPSEAGRVTSLVRYDAGSRFPEHRHPEGEEFLVLEGTFEDEHGTYPAGTFVLNPDGSRHAPASPEGCTIFVKLRQYPGRQRPRVVVDSRAARWRRTGEGREALTLLEDGGEHIRLVRFAPGTRIAEHEHPGGEEIFVIEGAIADELGEHRAGTWLRLPHGSRHRPRSETGCLLYVKSGHLAPLRPGR